ncbi:nuclear envelope integral membrane protein 2 [Leptodactylus fuscus]|uniref:nuclear envelope integral membrane protein 2 n=1 Tax=Leptodactylus fuscus TaxID=238119 RepID=UPI003F4F0F6E
MEVTVSSIITAMSLYISVYSVVRATALTQQDNECTPLNEGHPVRKTENHCFCYKPKWSPDIVWSAAQIHLQSTERVSVLLQLNCTDPMDMHAYISCWLHSDWKPRETKDVLIDVDRLDKDFCFHLNASNTPTAYTVTVRKIGFNLQIFAVLIGILLFCIADKLSRSSIFFYTTGTLLGMTVSVLFLLIVLRRFISKTSTFWLLTSMCCFLTAYVVQFLNENVTWIWTEKKPYVIGYFLTLGLLSFAACYSHGPLHSEFSINLFSWTLQVIGCILIYFGHPVYDIGAAVIAVLLLCKGLPYLFWAMNYIYRKMRQKKPIIRFLTEEEYNEQCEVETLEALKELRDFCRNPDFNSWLTISRLSSPKRFAEFVLGSNHVSSEEVTAHEQQYGLGSLFLEELVVQDMEVEPNLQVTVGQNENDYAENLDIQLYPQSK